MDAGHIKTHYGYCGDATYQKWWTYQVRSDYECTLPVAGPSGQQFHLHNLSRLHCSAPRWSPVTDRYAQHVSTTCCLPSCCGALWGLTTWLFLNYRVDSLTTSPLRYIFLNCAEKPTVACQVGWWEPSFSQCQPEAGDAKSLRLRCDYSQ